MKSNILLWAVILTGFTLAAFAANELNTQIQSTFIKNGATYQIAIAKQATVTGNYAHDVVYSIGTNGTAISFGAALPIGEVIIVNLTTNATRTISYGTNATSLFGMVPGGDFARFHPKDGGSNLWIKANLDSTLSNDVRVFGVSQ